MNVPKYIFISVISLIHFYTVIRLHVGELAHLVRGKTYAHELMEWRVYMEEGCRSKCSSFKRVPALVVNVGRKSKSYAFTFDSIRGVLPPCFAKPVSIIISRCFKTISPCLASWYELMHTFRSIKYNFEYPTIHDTFDFCLKSDWGQRRSSSCYQPELLNQLHVRLRSFLSCCTHGSCRRTRSSTCLKHVHLLTKGLYSQPVPQVLRFQFLWTL